MKQEIQANILKEWAFGMGLENVDVMIKVNLGSLHANRKSEIKDIPPIFTHKFDTAQKKWIRLPDALNSLIGLASFQYHSHYWGQNAMKIWYL